jgi:FixJ family two-component response regulator
VRQSNAVLVVDDDAAMLKALERLLTAHGVEVEIFESGIALRERGNLQDAACLILDINLDAGCCGIQLRQQLARSGVSTPVIFVTGNHSDRLRETAIQTGCIAYLVKPFTSESLLDAIARARSRNA